MIEILFLPMQPFLALPWLALVPAAAFGLCFWGRAQRASWRGLRSLLAALAWTVYAGYETAVQLGTAGDAAIRIDLLIVAPLLYLVSVDAVLLCRGTLRAKTRAGRRLRLGLAAVVACLLLGAALYLGL